MLVRVGGGGGGWETQARPRTSSSLALAPRRPITHPPHPPGIPATVRKVFVVGPDHKIKLQLIYPTAVGRNFAEIFRVIDALQLAAQYPIATPVNWTPGCDVMIQPTVSDADAEAKFPGFKRTAVPSGKSYIRFTADPSKKA